MFFAEVVETKKAFKDDQVDNDGNPLPLGSIEIRMGGDMSHKGLLRNTFARPATWNRRIPLIGEHVLCVSAPVNSAINDGEKLDGIIYWSPINATDDLVLHAIPTAWTRAYSKMAPSPGQRKADFKEPGYTFPKKPKKTYNIQPFEGDDLYEGRFGQSIRFGSTVEGDLSVYQHKPSWKGGSNTDPLMIFRVKKPSGGNVDNQSSGKSTFKSTNKFTIEDLGKDEVSMYMTTTQMLPKLGIGFKKNLDMATAPAWKNGSQIVLDADRIVINAKKDKAFLVGATEAVVTGKKVLLQSQNYKVDLDELMDFLKKWMGYDVDLATAKAKYATSSGPTAVSTNMAQYLKLKTIDFLKFKLP